jgi:CRISPR-associated endonuclease/helicase Cas3
MSSMAAEQFPLFYEAATLAIAELEFAERNGQKPDYVPKKLPQPKSAFPWQRRLAARTCRGPWPRCIALPTAAGKTACVDIAVFALACQSAWGPERIAPRRIFFVVDRRVVVDQAWLHANRLAAVLRAAQTGVLRDVADALRDLAQPGWRQLGPAEQERIRPLDVYALRGGMYRETAWVRTPLQPTFVASTVDQVGSRLLFRGYGVSTGLKPIHAGLVGNDSLILLDEAHCARPFSQTVEAVSRYRGWHDNDAPRSPFALVSLTATPAADVPDSETERDREDDRAHDVLGPRIDASKPTKLVVAERATGRRGRAELVNVLASEARSLMSGGFRAVGIIVNRVATARELRQRLANQEADVPDERRADVILLTGRMRPVDRDAVIRDLAPLFSNADANLARPVYVVATQCLEVGADLDFHALASECASLDALRQRFGRVNRVASRDVAKGVIVIRGDQTADTADDPVYGASLAETWKWLRGESDREEVDFGIAAMRSMCANLTEADYARLNAPARDAAVLLPAHLDCWVQTDPMPAPDPDPAVFLHGSESGVPDVQIVFRGDLGPDPQRWAEVVALCPPSSSEVLPVRIGVFRRWLASRLYTDESGDIEGEASVDPDDDLEGGSRSALLWKGPRWWSGNRTSGTVVISDPGIVQPGMTYVIPIAPGVEDLGDFPATMPHDAGDEAFQLSRDRAILRLEGLEFDADDDEFEARVTASIEAERGESAPEWLTRAVEHLSVAKNRRTLRYPEPLKGYVVIGRKRLRRFDPVFLEDDESSESPSGRAVPLDEHCRGVAAHARRFAEGCCLSGDMADRFALAGRWHDLGKLDPRFQAMLQGRSPRTIRRPTLAKSENGGGTLAERRAARAVHQYPLGGRHELLSVALAQTRTNDDLLLHLIATHHGGARPFATPVTEDESSVPRPFIAELFGEAFTGPSAAQDVAARNCELPERFWRIVRRFGWWGASYLEAVFRLADHAQSRLEQEQHSAALDEPRPVTLPASPLADARCRPLPLAGLDGSNPLAFLAAVGLLRALALKANEWVPRLSWEASACWVPVIWVPTDVNEATVSADLNDQLAVMREHPALRLGQLEADNLVAPLDKYRHVCQSAAEVASREDRTWADFCATFGSDAVQSENDPELMQDTAFRTMSGAGHQNFLGFFRNIVGATTVGHLEKALFQPWRYDDPLRNLTTRWDPLDDVRYALRWTNPSSENTLRSRSGSVLGANRLAIEGLPLFPSVPAERRLLTTGFTGRRASDTCFTWPIWTTPHCSDAVRSLVALQELTELHPDRMRLASFNVREVFRSRRITIGKYRNFSPAQAV